LNTFPEKWTLLDIEAVKTAAPVDWPFKMRFKTVMVGLGYWDDSGFRIDIYASDDEKALLEAVEDALGLSDVACYDATRDFDRIVLEGRWVNFFRRHSEVSGDWPSLEPVDESETDWRWLNLKKFLVTKSLVDRSADIEAVEVLTRWPKGDREPVWNHNLLDLVDFGLKVSNRFCAQ
jgi:hypothetical protein